MAQQPYMGSGLLLPPLSEVTKSCAFVAVGDWSAGTIKTLIVLKNKPYICFGQLTGHHQGQLAFTA
jgi:hypothetical protein